MVPKVLKVQATPTFARSHKMAKCSGNIIDRLPEEILVGVLSLLTIKEAARTSVLSKRWMDLWKHVTGSLDFDASKLLHKNLSHRTLLEKHRPKYIQWVNQVISLHQGPTIREFRAFFQLDATSASDVDKWIEFAIGKRVERLDLDFDFLTVAAQKYLFPEHIFYYIRSPGGSSCIQSLRYLSLAAIDVTGEHLEFILSSCPLLEELRVASSKLLTSLRVAACSLWLKHLKILYCSKVESIEVSAPKLVSFAYIGPSAKVLIRNAPMLVDLTIGGRFLPIFDALRMLSCYFFQLESLTLSDRDVEVDVEFMQSLQLPNLRNLTVAVHACDTDSFLGWTLLLKASPKLQKFRVELSDTAPEEIEEVQVVRCPHDSLKVVEFVGFAGRENEVELIMYLVENGPALEKIAIYCGDIIGLEYPWLFEEDEETRWARRCARRLKKKLPPGPELFIF